MKIYYEDGKVVGVSCPSRYAIDNNVHNPTLEEITAFQEKRRIKEAAERAKATKEEKKAERDGEEEKKNDPTLWVKSWCLEQCSKDVWLW